MYVRESIQGVSLETVSAFVIKNCDEFFLDFSKINSMEIFFENFNNYILN